MRAADSSHFFQVRLQSRWKPALLQQLSGLRHSYSALLMELGWWQGVGPSAAGGCGARVGSQSTCSGDSDPACADWFPWL